MHSGDNKLATKDKRALAILERSLLDDRSMISHFRDPIQLEIHQVINAAWVSNDLLSHLENEWGVVQGSLDLNDADNLVFLELIESKGFIHGAWTLIPSEELLDRMLAYDKEKDGTYLEAFPRSPLYKYHYVQAAGTYPIQRINLDPLPPGYHPDPASIQPHTKYRPSGAERSKIFYSPFTDIPPLLCHVHPFYALVHAGFFIQMWDRENTKNQDDEYKIPEVYQKLVEKARKVYAKWIDGLQDDSEFELQ